MIRIFVELPLNVFIVGGHFAEKLD